MFKSYSRVQVAPPISSDYLIQNLSTYTRINTVDILHVSANTVVAQVIIFKQIVSTLQGFLIEFLIKTKYCSENALVSQ